MALFQWTEAYSVQVKTFDGHHQHLFAMINELHDAMRAGKGRQVIGSLLDRLVRYADRHFNLEEEMMGEIEYPRLAAHIREHESFRFTLKKLRRTYETGGVVTHKLLDHLRDWLRFHIGQTDRAYGPHFKAKGIH